MALKDNQTFQTWWDQWIVVLEGVRVERPDSSAQSGSDADSKSSRSNPTGWFPT